MALNINDQSSNGNNLTNVNGVTEWTTNFPFVAITEAAQFTAASSQDFTAVENATLQGTRFTIEAWIQTTGNSIMIVQSLSVNPNHAGWYFFINNTGHIEFRIGKNTGNIEGTDIRTVTSVTAVNGGVWTHVAGAYDGVNQTVTINGTQDAQTASTIDPVYSSPNWRIGSYCPVATDSLFFNGEMTDIRYYGVGRTSAQINSDKSQLLTAGQSTPNAYYPFMTLSAGGAKLHGSLSMMGLGN